MILSGVITVIVLACSGLYVEKILQRSKADLELDQFNDYDPVELGIKPLHVKLIFK